MVKDGIVLGKRYAVLSKIGAGGMADVYKGRDQMLNRYVAIKVLKKQYKEDENFVRKFRSEAQAAAGLMHPNIVNVYDVGEDRGLNYMVMELVEGITLKEYIERKGRLSHKETISIAIQMCSGIGAAHASGIIHRDIKPQNIIISKDGKVKVTDFGIAKAVTSNTVSTNAMGSVHYTSPEQARGGFSDQRSDIYSIGITLFEMVTGQVPFDGETTVEVAMKHLQQEITPPSELVPDIPYSLEQIILKCTQKSVDRRYENMSEVIEDLKHSLLDPNGNFVVVTPLAQHAQTVMLSDDELEAIREGRSGYATPQKDTYEEEEDDDEEEYDDEYDDDEDGEVSSKLEKAMTIGGFIIGAIIICILIFFIARAAGLVNIGGTAKKDDTQQTEQEEIDDTVDENGQVSVPKLTSMTEENALSVLEQLGLKGNKTGESQSSEYKAGTIMSQETEAGTKVDQGTVINYVVSSGTDAPSVPSVTGKSQSEAEALIKALGLNTEIQQDYSDTVAIGKVISVNPSEGTKVDAGSTITLVVSLGEENKQVEVPNVIGQDEATAKKSLNDQGLQVNVETTTDASGNVAEGCVANQSVAAGTSVDPGSTITLQVYHAPETTTLPNEAPAEGDASDSDTGSWTCNVKLDQPSTYTGGPVQLTLVQNVNGQNVETVILDGQTITFPYTLAIAGADGVDTGTVYLREMVDGDYVERGHYSNVPFKQS